MEIFLAFSFFCFGPFVLVGFGYWLGRGAPGWPWAVIRRAGPVTPPGRS
ncbi:MAG: hypothetical protein HC875_36845, partial [Anaerolineales bacterium]|nr:hypothetical protein [Anaerolineales bacterium]